MNNISASDVLTFWFEELEPKQWWKVDPELDHLICTRFEPLLRQAALGELLSWRKTPKGRLAEIIVLDQFSRNIYRNTSSAFSQDPVALVLAQEAVAAGAHHDLSLAERGFLFVPYMHSESRLIHGLAEPLYREFGAEDNYNFELRHKAIIDQFGRYPHRNAILGRVSSDEELAFLKTPGSSF